MGPQSLIPLIPLFSKFLFWIIFFILLRIIYLVLLNASLKNSYLYLGKVKHTRLKGGSFHHFEYPIFFAYLDLDEIGPYNLEYWPIFSYGSRFFSFCSLDKNHHLKGWSKNDDFLSSVKSFILSKSIKNVENLGSVRLLTHLTYFGYCFNPVSFYYIFNKNELSKLNTIIAEVSNTPWMEQHAYVLNESIPNVEFTKRTDNMIQVKWDKQFHVSPFMEMNYTYE